MTYSVIDLFAGAGGLSLGFLETQRFEIKLAAENNTNAQLTYRRNHPNVELMNDVRKIDYNYVRQKYGNIDIVIGGPPCQGFSNANRQKNHAISANNSLVKEYVRAVTNLQPKVFVMENVSMLSSDVHRFFYSESDRNLIENLGISVKRESLELLPKGIQLKRIKDIIEDKNRANSYRWSSEAYLTLNILYKVKNDSDKIRKRLEKDNGKIEKYCKAILDSGDSKDQIRHWDFLMAEKIIDYLSGNNDSADSLNDVLKRPILVQRMLAKFEELKVNNIVAELKDYHFDDGVYVNLQSYSVLDYIQAVLSAEPNNYEMLPAVLNAAEYGAPQKRMRFILLGVKKEYSELLDVPKAKFTPDKFRTVRDAIEDLENIVPETNIAEKPVYINFKYNKNRKLAQLRDSELLYNHIATASRDVAKKRFEVLKPGQNFHDLSADLKNTYTDASRTQNTIYMRLNYDEPSGTVVNVRKSMWIHPVKNRALSIREAARLQTFPDSFIFEGTKDSQYQQVGNAVPPILAKSIAEKVLEILEGSDQ
jgi:DNA (cytosine-5)-methyltransferase 1